MRIMRIAVSILFAVTLALFVLYQVYDRQVNDDTVPEITSSADEISASVDAEDEILLRGLTANDNRDGDVSDTLVVVSFSKFIDTGKRYINYAAFDKNGNAGTYSRTLIYTDYTSPEFTLSEPLRYSAENSDNTVLDKIGALDCLDGDISHLIKFKYGSDRLGSRRTGTMSVNFQVTNSAGDTASLPLTMEILSAEEYELPYPHLSEYLIYCDPGESLSDTKLMSYVDGFVYRESVRSFGQTGSSSLSSVSYELSDVEVSSEVDYNTPGVYTVVFTLYDTPDPEDDTQPNTRREPDSDVTAERMQMGSVTMFVVVRE